MSKIGQQGAQNLAARTPWDDEGAREVRQLRRAITSHMSEQSVGSDLAPMMAELLSRLDELVGDQAPGDLGPPAPPMTAEPPTPEQAASALIRAHDKIRQMAHSSADPQTRASLENMAQVLKRHTAMKQEVLMRASVAD